MAETDSDPTCARCSKPIKPGAAVRFSSEGWTHLTCETRDRALRHLETREQLQRSREQLREQVKDARALIREARKRSGLPADPLLVATDRTGRLLLFNAACEAVTGYLRSDVLGLPLLEVLVPEPWRPAMAKRLEHASDESLAHPFRCPWRARSGEERMIEWRYGVREPGTPDEVVFGIGTVVD